MRRYLRAFLAFAVQPNQNAMEENENIINVEVTEPSLPPPPAPENQCMDEGAINESLPETQTLENENTGDEVACQEYYCDEKPKVQRQAERQSVVDMKLIALQLRDEISGAHARVMREIAQAANDQLAAIVNPPARPPTCQFHQKTGQVRMPRALPESGWYFTRQIESPNVRRVLFIRLRRILNSRVMRRCLFSRHRERNPPFNFRLRTKEREIEEASSSKGTKGTPSTQTKRPMDPHIHRGPCHQSGEMSTMCKEEEEGQMHWRSAVQRML
jgi:hypothetical protein